ncbi:hypothetical protein [Varibaculum prostatecancerukia]|uniref:hypothetical protein n=1 Tax=Varibaculum prostatecancerukia TaxID=2811781 RepID=UPI001C000861|nr:hypothetical protein [Varibaculum prostatecancerukia]
MSKFSPDKGANDGSSEPTRTPDSGLAPQRAGAPKGMSGNKGASYSPSPQGSGNAQTYPQYPAGAPVSPGAYPPANPPVTPVYPGQPAGNYPGQPIATNIPGRQLPPSYPAAQQVPPNYPEQPAPGASVPQPGGKPIKNNKSYRVPIIVLCVVLVVALCALGTVLYKVLSRDDSLAVGVKPAWEKPAKVQLETKGEPGLAYTLYSPEKGKLILLQPFKDGTGTAQMLDPKTGAKSGRPITLPKCDNSLKYPYQIKGGKIVCATKEIIKANTNKKYQFKEEIFINAHLVVGASPSATNATQIVAYSPKTSKLLWVQNLKKPASVTCNGKAVYTTSVVGDSSLDANQDVDEDAENPEPENAEDDEEDEQTELEVMALDGSSQAQAAPEKQLSKVDTQPSEPQVAKDAIKNIDFANAYLPFFSDQKCPNENFWQKSDRTPVANKMPEGTSACWATMKNGSSVEKFRFSPQHPETELDAIKLADQQISDLFDSASFKPDPTKSYAVGYGDVNADGYLDALLVLNDYETTEFALAIFDPDDPDHPYLSVIGPAMQDGVVKIVSPGRVNIYGSDPITGSGSPELVSEMSIQGFEITNYSEYN